LLIIDELGVVDNAASLVVVMYVRKIVETVTVDEIFYDEKHPYTWGLLGSMPKLHAETEELHSIPGTPPDLKDPPKGCPFAARCSYAMKACKNTMPVYTENSPTHNASCWRQDEREPKVEPPDDVLAGGAKQS